MVELAHELDLVDQRLLALVLGVGGLLAEGLDGEALVVLQPDRQVHRGEVALADLLDGLEELVEAALVDARRQVVPPLFEYFFAAVVHVEHVAAALELQREGRAYALLDLVLVGPPEHLEDQVEVKNNTFVRLVRFRGLRDSRITVYIRM